MRSGTCFLGRIFFFHGINLGHNHMVRKEMFVLKLQQCRTTVLEDFTKCEGLDEIVQLSIYTFAKIAVFLFCYFRWQQMFMSS